MTGRTPPKARHTQRPVVTKPKKVKAAKQAQPQLLDDRSAPPHTSGAFEQAPTYPGFGFGGPGSFVEHC